METQQQRELNREQSQERQYNQEQQYGAGPAGQREEFQPVGERQQTRTMEQGGQNNDGLMAGQEMERFSTQWTSIQAAFVDEPRRAVEQADRLVEEVIQHLSRTFSNERQKLESQWSRGDQVSTEDLRVALQRYRQFFQNLLRS